MRIAHAHRVAEEWPLDEYLAEKATASGGARAEFAEWFLAELEREANLAFIRGRDQMLEVLSRWLQQYPRPLATAELLELNALVFDLSTAVSLDLTGLDVPSRIAERLKQLGFSRTERVGFTQAAFRFGGMRERAAATPPSNYRDLRAMATRMPLTPIEESAMRWAALNAAEQLRPIFMADGSVITEARLQAERLQIQAMVTNAYAERIDALQLGRDLYRLRQPDAYRDYERVARTELANSYAHGAFHHEVAKGRWQPEDEVYRIPRPTACKICLTLFTNPDGTYRLYRVADLLAERTPLVNVGVRKERLVRATIGVPHPNDLCAPWIKAWRGRTAPGDAGRYRAGRQEVGLDVE